MWWAKPQSQVYNLQFQSTKTLFVPLAFFMLDPSIFYRIGTIENIEITYDPYVLNVVQKAKESGHYGVDFFKGVKSKAKMEKPSSPGKERGLQSVGAMSGPAKSIA